MAQIEIFIPLHGVYCEANSEWTSDNISADADIVQLTMGVRISEDSRVRGARVITTGGTHPSALDPKPITPYIWIEGEIHRFEDGVTYKFLDPAHVTVAQRVTI